MISIHSFYLFIAHYCCFHGALASLPTLITRVLELESEPQYFLMALKHFTFFFFYQAYIFFKILFAYLNYFRAFLLTLLAICFHAIFFYIFLIRSLLATSAILLKHLILNTFIFYLSLTIIIIVIITLIITW